MHIKVMREDLGKEEDRKRMLQWLIREELTVAAELGQHTVLSCAEKFHQLAGLFLLK